MFYEIIIFIGLFLMGYVAGELKNDLFDYWNKLDNFLDYRDEKVIRRLKK